jgi:hypothetical protein
MKNKKATFKDIIITIILTILISILILVPIFLLIMDANKTYYVMPDGIECKVEIITGGGFGGATHEFSQCSNGKTYINPETYKTLKREK